MTDDELTRAYDALRRQRQARPAVAPPSLDALQSLAENQTAASEREALLERVLESGASDELALLHSIASGTTATATAVSDARTSNARHGSGTPSWTRWWPAAAAAAVVLAVGLPMVRRGGNAPVPATAEQPRFRGAESTGAPTLLAPANEAVLPADQRFVWSSVTDATQYEIELVDADGQLVLAFTATDTTAPLPVGSSDAQRARARGWTVSARLRDGGVQRSALRLLRAP